MVEDERLGDDGVISPDKGKASDRDAGIARSLEETRKVPCEDDAGESGSDGELVEKDKEKTSALPARRKGRWHPIQRCYTLCNTIDFVRVGKMAKPILQECRFDDNRIDLSGGGGGGGGGDCDRSMASWLSGYIDPERSHVPPRRDDGGDDDGWSGGRNDDGEKDRPRRPRLSIITQLPPTSASAPAPYATYPNNVTVSTQRSSSNSDSWRGQQQQRMSTDEHDHGYHTGPTRQHAPNFEPFRSVNARYARHHQQQQQQSLVHSSTASRYPAYSSAITHGRTIQSHDQSRLNNNQQMMQPWRDDPPHLHVPHPLSRHAHDDWRLEQRRWEWEGSYRFDAYDRCPAPSRIPPPPYRPYPPSPSSRHPHISHPSQHRW